MSRALALVSGIFAALACVSAAAQPASPAATPAVVSVSCAELPRYGEAMIAAYPDLTDTELESLTHALGPFDGLSEVRSEHLRVAATYFDTLAGNVESIDSVPNAIAGLHNAYIGRLVLSSRLMNAHIEGSAFDVLYYREQLNANADTVREETEAVAAACGDAWLAIKTAEPYVFGFMWTDWYEQP